MLRPVFAALLALTCTLSSCTSPEENAQTGAAEAAATVAAKAEHKAWWGETEGADLAVQVKAKKFSWSFQYPNGYVNADEMIVPAGKMIQLAVTSADVLHCFYCPQLKIRKDAVPGRQNKVRIWTFYDPRKPKVAVERVLRDISDPGIDGKGKEVKFVVNVYEVFCAEYCGADHARMTGRLVVVDPKDYAQFMRLTAANGGQKL